jgi:hypothetical protein
MTGEHARSEVIVAPRGSADDQPDLFTGIKAIG